MAAISTWERALRGISADPAEDARPCWYVAYTSANHEKRVADQLGVRSVEHFLALYETVRQWKDRRKRLDLPIFPGYVFVRLPLRDRLRVEGLPGVARLVGFGGRPAALPDAEIDALRNVLQRGLRAEPHPYLTAGRHVRIIRGPLTGCQGTLVRKRGLFHLVVSIDLIQRAAAVEVDAADVEPAQQPGTGEIFRNSTR